MVSVAERSMLSNISTESAGLARLEATDFDGEAHNTNLLDSTMPDLPKLELSQQWTAVHAQSRRAKGISTPPSATSKYIASISSTRQISSSSTTRTGGWTPSPDQSTSKQGTKASIASNESLGSSLGTFDYSNASFSESFLRRAGAHMLAGLKDSPQSDTSSSSPAHFSSSPTIKGSNDPRTPHITKAWQRRLLEAATLASPGSSEGSSSPASSLGFKTPVAKRFNPSMVEASPSDMSAEPTTRLGPLSAAADETSEAALAATSGARQSIMNVDVASTSVSSIIKDESPGLSMVEEESFEQELSRLVDEEESKAVAQKAQSYLSVPLQPPTSAPSTDANTRPANSPEEAVASPSKASSALGTEASPDQVLRLRPRLSPKPLNRPKQATPVRSPLCNVVSPGTTPVSNASARSHIKADLNETTPLQTEATKEAADLTTESTRKPHTANDSPTQAVMESPPSAFHSFAMPSAIRSSNPEEQSPDGKSALFSTPSSTQPSLKLASSSSPIKPFSPSAYDTPSWTPSPPSLPRAADTTEFVEAQDELSPSNASSSNSASSGRKEGGDESHHNVLLDEKYGTHHELTMNNVDSPSVVRHTKLELQRSFASLSPMVTSSEDANPELSAVQRVFDKMSSLLELKTSQAASQLSEARSCNSILAAQLDEASVAESSLRTASQTSAEQLSHIQFALKDLATRYDKLLEETNIKDQQTAELLETLQNKLQSRSATNGQISLEQLLAEEKRQRGIERRDFEVRLSAMSSPQKVSSRANGLWITEDDLRDRMEQTKSQVWLTAEKDFQVRRDIELRHLLDRVAELEARSGASVSQEGLSSPADAIDKDLIAQLDSRDEDIAELRSKTELLESQNEAFQDRIRELEDNVNEHSNSEADESLNDRLQDQKAEIQRLEETLQLTQSQLHNVTTLNETLKCRDEQLTSEIDALRSELDERAASESASSSRTQMLEEEQETLKAHIILLEKQLRSHQSSKPTDLEAASPQKERVKVLERQVADLDLKVVKLQKANEALQADYMISSIALSAKQLELGMVKRNARFALKASSQQSPAKVMLETAKIATPAAAIPKAVEFPAVPTSSFNKENEQPQSAIAVNNARAQARQMLALRQSQLAQEPRQMLAA